jgi:hypothetical protein
MTQYLSKEEAGRKRERKQVVVDRELDRLYKKHNTITTDLVLDAASNPKHALHTYFEWDDSVAAHKYRQAQATAMILASKMVAVLKASEDDGPPQVIGGSQQVEVRRLVNAYRGGGFKMRNEALKNLDSRAALVEKKKGVLRSWCSSVVDIQELATLRKLIEKHL